MELHPDLAFLNGKRRSLIETAAYIGYAAHLRQVRKDDQAPYFIHPCMAALTLKGYGFSDEVVAAAFVHDVLEDTHITKEALSHFLGDTVVEMVSSLSEDKALPWRERKQKYIETIRDSSEGVRAISVADKIHNLESVFAAYELHGPAVWSVFNKGREDKCWFERSLLEALTPGFDHPLIKEYARLVDRLDELK